MTAAELVSAILRSGCSLNSEVHFFDEMGKGYRISCGHDRIKVNSEKQPQIQIVQDSNVKYKV